MKDNELKELLNAVYEMEGMIHLSLNRKQDPGLLRELIVKKSESIARLASSLSPEEVGDTAATAGNPAADNSGICQADDDKAGDAAPITDAETAPIAEPDTEPITVPIARPVTEPVQPKTRPAARPELRRCFPINEIYLFRRELFDGSDVDFNASLRIVEELPTYAAAEDYFISDLQWDRSDPTVADFLNIIRRSFKK